MLNAYLFESLEEAAAAAVRILSVEWMDNHNRLHKYQDLAEMLVPNFQDQRLALANQFSGMSAEERISFSVLKIQNPTRQFTILRNFLQFNEAGGICGKLKSA
ncbi:hypothetical protein [Dyadobacter sp. 22481]|uniref:hypothetical protein n=1 Tax=Dyadobacter sp. 22481 TaxID=3453926 RepID=UPI003F871BBD